MSHHSREDAAAGAVAAVAIAAIVLVFVLVIATLSEVGRVYATRATPQAPTARPLWTALAALLGAWGAAALLVILAPSMTWLGMALAAWATLAWVIFAEVVDQRALARELEGMGEVEDLDTYLTRLTAPPPVHSNGASRPIPELAR